MATIRCISQDGDWTAAGSWAGGVVPGASDTALFDGTTQRDMLTNLASAADLTNLITTEAYRGNIGSSGNPLINDITNRFTVRGSGEVHWQAESVTSNGLSILVHSPNTVLALRADYSAAETINVVIRGGRVEVAGGNGTDRYSLVPRASAVAILDTLVSVIGIPADFIHNVGGIVLGNWDIGSSNIEGLVQVRGTMDLRYLDGLSGIVNVFGGTFSIGQN